MKAKKKEIEAKIPELKTQVLKFRIRGVTSLVVHNPNEKYRHYLISAHTGQPQEMKEDKNPEDCFIGSLYAMPGKKPPFGIGETGVPATWFKKAIVGACRFVDGVPMTQARGSFHVLGDLLPVLKQKPEMRFDITNVGQQGGYKPDSRWRGEYKPGWEVDVSFLVNPLSLNPAKMAHLLKMAGFSNGIGEGRPEKKSALSWGMFDVVNASDA